MPTALVERNDRKMAGRGLLGSLLVVGLIVGLAACGGNKHQNTASANRLEAQAAENNNVEMAGAGPAQEKPSRPSSSRGVIEASMKNVDFHVQDAVVLRIRDLRGALVKTSQASTPTFDDKKSFTLRIDSGVIGIASDSLSNLMNNYIFAYDHSPLKKISVSMDGSQIKLKGIMHKVIDVHIDVVGSLAATPEGKIRLHPDKIKADGIPIKGFMHLFGVELDELVKAREARGVKVVDDDLVLDPELMTPPPAIRGKVTSVQIAQDEVVQVFGGGNQSSRTAVVPSSTQGANYMHFKGGTLGFGKLTMADADLEIVSEDTKGPFDFSMDHYSKQLVAGYSKTTPSLGLVVFMPNYSKLQRGQENVTAKAR
jgi:hypothetical protein